MMTAVRSFQRKLDIFREDLEGECEQGQIQGDRDVSPCVDLIDKLLGNFSKRSNSFCLGQQILLLIQNPFLISQRIFRGGDTDIEGGTFRISTASAH